MDAWLGGEASRAAAPTACPAHCQPASRHRCADVLPMWTGHFGYTLVGCAQLRAEGAWAWGPPAAITRRSLQLQLGAPGSVFQPSSLP